VGAEGIWPRRDSETQQPAQTHGGHRWRQQRWPGQGLNLQPRDKQAPSAVLCTAATKRVRRALTEGLKSSLLKLPLDHVLHRLMRCTVSNRPLVNTARNILASTWTFWNLLMRNLQGHACCSLLGGWGAGPRRRHDKQRQCHLSSAATTRSNTQRCQATHTKGKTGPGRWVTYRKTLIQKSVQQDVRYIWEIPIDGLRGGYVVHLRRQQPGSTAGPLGPTDLFKPATSPRTDAVESTWTH
jgi:hypothetical protein